jgi:hypothetical protein
LISGSLGGIVANVDNGAANIVFNGDVKSTNPSVYYDVGAVSNGSGSINISGSGNAVAGGITAIALGSGSITIGGSGNTTDLLNASGIDAFASGGNITINRSGFITGATNGVNAVTTGAGNITITTTGDVTGHGGVGVTTSVGTGIATLNVNAGSTISGSSGPLAFTGTSIVNNAGTLNFVNDATSNTVLNTTTLNGLGGRLAIDVNAAGGTADRLTVTTLSGNTVIQAHNIGGGLISTPIPVLVATASSSGAIVTANNGPSLINYNVIQSGNTFSLTSSVNTSAASATPAGIGAILTALNTGFFQNASAFIAEPPHPSPNQWNGGPWVRFSGGQNDVSATTSAQNPNGTAFAPSKVRTNFNGFQTGMDLGVANVENTGWNTHLGVTAGQVLLNTNDLLLAGVNSASQVPFIGIYGAVTGHGFFADFQVREDFYGLKITNPAANLRDENLNGNALAANVSAGYRWDLPQSWFIEPSGALMYSQLHTDTLAIKLDSVGGSTGSLNFMPFNSLLGRLGFRVGTTYVLDQYQLALQPFGTASVWHEFEGDTLTNFVSGASIVPLAVTRIGTFGQLGLGVSGQVLQTGLLGFVRADWRFGQNLSGYAVVGGMRYQF